MIRMRSAGGFGSWLMGPDPPGDSNNGRRCFFRTEDVMMREKDLSRHHPDAVFIGWMHFRSGNSIALYNIILTGHPSYGSSVTASTLRRLNLSVPPTPPPVRTMNGLQKGDGAELRAGGSEGDAER